jgi:hypothetical protein
MRENDAISRLQSRVLSATKTRMPGKQCTCGLDALAISSDGQFGNIFFAL